MAFRRSDERVLSVIRLHRQGGIGSNAFSLTDRLAMKIQDTFLGEPVVGIGSRLMEWISPPHHFPFDMTGTQWQAVFELTTLLYYRRFEAQVAVVQ